MSTSSRSPSHASPHGHTSATFLREQPFGSPTVVVTGGARGIGLELCRQLKARGARVIALCRDLSQELKTLHVEYVTGIEVGVDEVEHRVHQALIDVRIDALIHNAGMLYREGLEQLSMDHVREQFETNALGPVRVTRGLLQNLHEGSKVLIISSKVGSIGLNTTGAHYGYRMTKAAVNAAGVSLSIDLKPRGIAVGMVHPGHVRTAMGGAHAPLSVEESAAGLLARLDGLNLETSGTFWNVDGTLLPW